MTHSGNSTDDHRAPDEALAGLALLALEHAVESVEEGGPLIPFVLEEQGGQKTLHRFCAQAPGDPDSIDMDQSVEQAKAHFDAAGSGLAVLAVDGFLREGETRVDAIWVDARHRDARGLWRFAQPYRPASRSRKAAAIGNPMLVEYEDRAPNGT